MPNQLRSSILIVSIFLAACSGGSDKGPTNVNSGSGTVRGKVTDDAGAPVVGAQVQAFATGQTTRGTTSGSDGSFVFTSIKAGVWQLGVVPPSGYAGGSTPTVTVTNNQEATAATIVLTRLAEGEAVTAATVSIYLSAFGPQQVTVRVGGVVTFRNNDDLTHTATGSNFDTGDLQPGQARNVTFNDPGTFNYICSIHTGMSGRVIVQ